MGNEEKTKSFEERFKAEQEATDLANKQAAEPITETTAAETTEAVEETTTETTESEATEQVSTEAAKPVEKTWEEIKAEFEQQEQERIDKEEYEEWKKDQFAQDYRKAKKQGVDVKTFVNGIADIDVSLISDETLFKNSLADKKLSESDLEDEWNEFKDQKDYIKENYLKDQRDKITKQIEDKRKSYKGNLVIENPSEVYSEAKTGLDNFLGKAVNTKVEGVLITPKMAQDLLRLTPKFFATSMKNGKVDVTDAFDTAFAKLAKTEWRDDLIAQGKTDGLLAAHAEKHSPNPTSMVTTKKTVEKTKEQKEEEEFRAKLGQKPQSFLTDK
jgi:hypothetical protein